MLPNTTLHRPTFDPLAGVRRDMGEAFEQLLGRDGHAQPRGDGYYAPLTIWEDDEHVFLEVDVPGLRTDDIDLTFKNGCLWISGERSVPKQDGKYWHDERMYGRFERAVRLPESVDPESIDAGLENGVLSVRLAKKAEARPTRIAINEGGNGRTRLASNKAE